MGKRPEPIPAHFRCPEDDTLFSDIEIDGSRGFVPRKGGEGFSPEQDATVSRFLEFVRMHNPELIPVLETISSCTSYS